MSEALPASTVIADEHLVVARRVYKNMEALHEGGHVAGVRAASVESLRKDNSLGCLRHIEGVQRVTMRRHNLTPAE